MARFLLVLQPPADQPAAAVLASLTPVLDALEAEVDHRTPAHLSALLKGSGEAQRMQLFADLQAKADGQVLELVLLSREAMGTRAPITRRTFEQLIALTTEHLTTMQLLFRSDRDGALPRS